MLFSDTPSQRPLPLGRASFYMDPPRVVHFPSVSRLPEGGVLRKPLALPPWQSRELHYYLSSQRGLAFKGPGVKRGQVSKQGLVHEAGAVGLGRSLYPETNPCGDRVLATEGHRGVLEISLACSQGRSG